MSDTQDKTLGVGFLILDTETTGLPSEDPIHRPYEIAWRTVTVDFEKPPSEAVQKSSITRMWLTNDVPLNRVSQWTLEQPNYHRWIADFKNHHDPQSALSDIHISLLRARIPGNGRFPFYQVGANPGFDRKFLDAWLRKASFTLPLRHRMWDTDNLAAMYCNSFEPLGLEESVNRLFFSRISPVPFIQAHCASDDVDAATLVLEHTLLSDIKRMPPFFFHSED